MTMSYQEWQKKFLSGNMSTLPTIGSNTQPTTPQYWPSDWWKSPNKYIANIPAPIASTSFNDQIRQWQLEVTRADIGRQLAGQEYGTAKATKEAGTMGRYVASGNPLLGLFQSIKDIKDIFAKSPEEKTIDDYATQSQYWITWMHRASGKLTFYTAVTFAVATGKVNSIEDFLDYHDNPTNPDYKALTDEDKEEFDAVIKSLAGKNLPIKPTAGEGEEGVLWPTGKQTQDVVNKLTGKIKIKAPHFQKLTIDYVIKALTRPPPPGIELTDAEGMLSLMKTMGLDTETIASVDSITQIAEWYSEAALEQSKTIDDVIAGDKDWEINISLNDRLKMLVTSPAQLALDTMNLYLRWVSYPIFGSIFKLAQSQINGQQEIEKLYESARKDEPNWWLALGEAWDENTYPWAVKVVVEISLDPTTYIPGWGLSLPGKGLIKFGETVVGKKLMSQAIGQGMLDLNVGMYKVLGAPFDYALAKLRNLPKTSNQLAKFNRQAFTTITNDAAHEFAPGKTWMQLTDTELGDLLNIAVKAAKDTPLQTNPITQFGKELLKASPIGKTQLADLSKVLGGRLTEDAISPTILKEANEILAAVYNGSMKVEVGATNLTKLIGADFTEQSLAKVSTYMGKQVAKLESQVTARIVDVGKDATENKVNAMLGALYDRQRTIYDDLAKSEFATVQNLHGVMLGLVKTVDRAENYKYWVALNRNYILPMAASRLYSFGYSLWNALEGFTVSMIGGAKVGMTTRTEFELATRGLIGVDPLLTAWKNFGKEAGDPALMNLASRNLPWTLGLGEIPDVIGGVKFPKRILDAKFMPEIIVGGAKLPNTVRTLPLWLGKMQPELSNIWGSQIKANFLVERIGHYMHLGTERFKATTGMDLLDFYRGVMNDFPKINTGRIGTQFKDFKSQAERLLKIAPDGQAIRNWTAGVNNTNLTINEAIKGARELVHVSPPAIEDMIAKVKAGEVFKGKILDNIHYLTDSAGKLHTQDLATGDRQIAKVFRFHIDSLLQYPINTKDDLMEVLSEYVIMADTATRMPERLSQLAMQDSMPLRTAKNLGKLNEFFRTRDTETLNAVDEMLNGLGEVRRKILDNSKLLSVQQESALDDWLRLEEGRYRAIKKGTEEDIEFKKNWFTDQRKKKHTEEEWATNFWATRMEHFRQMRTEDALEYGGLITRRESYANMLGGLPKQRLGIADARNTAITRDLLATAAGCKVPDLFAGVSDVMTMQSKEHFIQYFLARQRVYPKKILGFTEEKLGAAYDSILKEMHLVPDVDIQVQKGLQQLQGYKQKLMNLMFAKMLTPDDEAKLLAWGEKTATNLDGLLGTKAKKVVGEIVSEGVDTTGASKLSLRVGGKEASYITFIDEPKSIFITLNVTKEGFKRQGYASRLVMDLLGRAEKSGKKLLSGTATDEGEAALRAMEKKGQIRLTDTGIKGEGYVVTRGAVTEKPLEAAGLGMQWSNLRQEALHKAQVDYYATFADYTNENVIDAAGKMLNPFHMYFRYKPMWLARTAIQHPGLALAWAKWNNRTDEGAFQIPWLGLALNPFIGSVAGMAFGLTRPDYDSYYDGLGWPGKILDTATRWGWFPGDHITQPIALAASFKYGQAPLLGEFLPPELQLGVNFFVGSKIPGVSDLAKTIQDKVLSDNFRDYFTAVNVNSIQLGTGGKLAGGINGEDLWKKIKNKATLTEEEKDLWDRANEKTAWYMVLNSQFPGYRLRPEEVKEVKDNIAELITIHTGVTRAQQQEIRDKGLTLGDVIGGLPLDLQTALDSLWQYDYAVGLGTILASPDQQAVRLKVEDYYSKKEEFQVSRIAALEKAALGFLYPTADNVLNGLGYLSARSDGWGSYHGAVEGLDNSEEYKDIATYMSTPEGRIELAKKEGYSPPTYTPLKDAIFLYYSIELEQTKNLDTGVLEWDYDRYYLKRQAVRWALTDAQLAEFNAYIRRNENPNSLATRLENKYQQINEKYFKGYQATRRVVFESYPEEIQELLNEYYNPLTDSSRREEIRNYVNPGTNRKLISNFDSDCEEARRRLRTALPELDFYLRVFGKVTTSKTPEADAMFKAWEKDRSSILE